jgi:hypothetical protein
MIRHKTSPDSSNAHLPYLLSLHIVHDAVLPAYHCSGPNDKDMMSFKAAAGNATVQLLPLPASAYSYGRSNLYMTVEIKNSNNEVLVTGTMLGAAADFDVPIPAAGIYYVSLAGAGYGDPAMYPGFSSYGSRGQYQLKLAYTAANITGACLLLAIYTILNGRLHLWPCLCA